MRYREYSGVVDEAELPRLLRELATTVHDCAVWVQTGADLLEGQVSDDTVARMIGLMSRLVGLRDGLAELATSLEENR